MIRLIEVQESEQSEKINMTIETGQMLCVTGMGRNSLLRMIGGLNTPYSGHIEINGCDLASMDEQARVIFRRRYLSYIYKDNNLIDFLTVRDNINIINNLDGKDTNDYLFSDIMNCLSVIYNSLDAYPAEMDTLQQFCTTLARGVVSNHSIMLIEDLEMMKNMKYIEDYLGILKILNQKKHITMILSMINNQYRSLFDKFFYI